MSRQPKPASGQAKPASRQPRQAAARTKQTGRQPKPASNEPAIRLVMMPRDTNGQGSIFGGVILSLIDQAAYVEAIRQAHHRYVTVTFREVEFHEPVFVGDVLSLYAHTTRIGRTSMTIRVRVCAHSREESGGITDVTQAEVVMVAVDENRSPIPILAD